MANNLSHKTKEQDPDTADLTNEAEDASLVARYSRKPTSFDIDDVQEGDIEDSLVKERGRMKRRRDWMGFWHTVTVSLGWKGSLDGVYEEVPVEDGLLENRNTPRRTRRKRN